MASRFSDNQGKYRKKPAKAPDRNSGRMKPFDYPGGGAYQLGALASHVDWPGHCGFWPGQSEHANCFFIPQQHEAEPAMLLTL